MSGARKSAVKSFEVYRRDNGRTGIVRTLHHDPHSGRSWVTEVHEKSGAGDDSLRIETTTELADMDPEDQTRYELRLRNELEAEQAALPPV
ncbi:hypothetical protein ENSA5_43960 [Enhygromyxa salina]|uniref:Uncharacterized protein n=1 Tax=Enhygromyxa salina TaxID=215803 RepID=A0A2S9XK06_9BACT|nr:hypothetical protein [Enhygromyxa salina]PRP93219.1 hypothetical protein ENSA5_43960 [Enhygromyxa salina]